MSNRQRFQQQEVGAYNGHSAHQIYHHHPDEHATSALHSNPQQFGFERHSAHSILRRSPALSSSSASVPGGNAARSPGRQRQEPLVLDASSSSAAAATPLSAPPPTASQNFLRNIWKDRRPASPHHQRHHLQQQQLLYPAATHYYGASSLSSSESVQSHPLPQHQQLHSSDLFAVSAGEPFCGVAASTIARDPASAHAGFLQKLGQNVPVWKRRFFVLEKPRASLYYFLSPNDTSPRGCLDLEGAQVYVPTDNQQGADQDVEAEKERSTAAATNSHTWRMELFWPDTNKCIQLEAKSQEARDAWVEALQTNQYGCVEQSLSQAQHKLSACASRIGELEHEVKNYKLVEQELQASQLEAKSYKAKFEELDRALRKLQAHLRRGADEEALQGASTQQSRSVNQQDSPSSPSAPTLADGSEENAALDEDCKKRGPLETSTSTTPMRDTSLLDASVEDDLDVWNVPGTHFAGLYNVCEQLKQTVRLSQSEASQAVTDCSEAQAKVEAIEKRMAKAEKHLCKLWEENCGLRKVLKQRKRERQVLVREVKTLREEAVARSAEQRNAGAPTGGSSEPRALDDDEEQLLNELEAHVITSIRLHEQLLGSPLKGAAIETPAASKSMNDHPDDNDKPGQEWPASADSRSASVATTASATSASAVTSNPVASKPNQRPVASLLDDQSDSDDDDDMSSAPSISSINVEAASIRELRDLEDHRFLNDGRPKAASTTSSVASTQERPNPILQLDEESVSTHDNESRTTTSAQAFASRGEATSQLHCPFADVIETKHRNAGKNNPLRRSNDELQVYHLTFYSRKIGLQFQKVPPPPEKKTGLLTDAIAADLRGTSNSGGNKTASELRRIAAITNRAKPEGDIHSRDEACQVAKPIDAVIVCGFDGFDDSGTNVRPSLGARLVAFDGVSVEVGKWTFDSIRKSIQARSRPLTLSFRDDYLTTEQRAILTKALANVSSIRPPPKASQRPVLQRRPSVDPSDHSALSHESSTFVNGTAARTVHDDEMSGVSVRSGSSVEDHQYKSPFPSSFSGARSASSSIARDRQYAFRSFSDAGSSTSMISSVAPLVTSLLYRTSKDPFTPDYLLRKPEPVENTPQHQDFQSELL